MTTRQRRALASAASWAHYHRAALVARNRAIVRAHESGATYREIGRATGIPHTTIWRVVLGDKEAT